MGSSSWAACGAACLGEEASSPGTWHDDDSDSHRALRTWRAAHAPESLHCDGIIIGYSLEEERKGHQYSAYPPQSPPNTIRDTLLDKPVRKGQVFRKFDSTRRWRLRFWATTSTSSVSASTKCIIAEDLSGKPAGL
jgi:hypothetical protein